MEEKWKDIIEADGKYQISNLGRVRNKTHILKPTLTREGYMEVTLYNNGTRKKFFVHRLVAMYFVNNPNNYNQVNHIDEDGSNNIYTNLEWCTQHYNTNYGNRTRRQIQSMSIPILVYYKNGEFIKEYSSIKECGKCLGIHDKFIIDVLKGKCKTTHGYTFRYKYNRDDYFTTIGYRALKKIYQYDDDMNIIKQWDSSLEVVENNKGYNRRYIADACKYGIKAYGYYWRYKIDVEIEN